MGTSVSGSGAERAVVWMETRHKSGSCARRIVTGAARCAPGVTVLEDNLVIA
jgi:hypothetical protein